MSLTMAFIEGSRPPGVSSWITSAGAWSASARAIASCTKSAAAELRDRRLRPQQRLRRELAERDDDLGRDQLELADEKGLARRHLVRLQVAVLRRPALDDVGNVHVLSPEPHPLGDDLGQQLPGAPDERLALDVLVATRRLPDEHQPRPGVADPEHDVRAMRRELAAVTVADRLAQLGEGARLCHAGLGEEIARRGVDPHGTRVRGGGRVAPRKAEHSELALVLDVRGERAGYLRQPALRGRGPHCTISGRCGLPAPWHCSSSPGPARPTRGVPSPTSSTARKFSPVLAPWLRPFKQSCARTGCRTSTAASPPTSCRPRSTRGASTRTATAGRSAGSSSSRHAASASRRSRTATCRTWRATSTRTTNTCPCSSSSAIGRGRSSTSTGRPASMPPRSGTAAG